MGATLKGRRTGRTVRPIAAHSIDSGLRVLMEMLPAVRALPWPRVLTFAAGKGGVGKSSSTANVGGILAAAGYRVLVVDLDVQANQAALLGVVQDEDRVGELDDGRSFLSAIVSGDPDMVRPLVDVRPQLHLIPAGLSTRKLSDYLTMQSPQERRRLVRDVIEYTAKLLQADMVIIDSRPAGEVLGEVSLLVADYLTIPLKTDALSGQGLSTIARLYGEAGADARLLGAYLFATGSSNTRIQADTRSDLEARLEGIAPVLQTVIPHSEKAAKDQSMSGLTADEYAAAADALARPFYEDSSAPTFARNSDGISAAYASLAVEIVTEMLGSPDE
jgi:chromosome partitioning protein